VKSVNVRLLFAVFVPVFAAAAASAQPPEHMLKAFAEAEKRIVRLPPAAFPGLPTEIVRALEKRGCTIPQPALSEEPRNVVQGEFAQAGQKDWAVLCSVNGVSTILVFWNGSGMNPASLAPSEDQHSLQKVTETEIGFSRGIHPVGRDAILRCHEAYGGPAPPPVHHQGIDDAFIGKASVIWYFYDGKWRKLTGAD
jgi:hypothetical protein